jgi:hypothetical protein
MVEAVEPFKLHRTSIAYIYMVLKYLNLLWMGIWLHTYTITTIHVSPDLGEFAEILGNVSVQVQTMPLHYD